MEFRHGREDFGSSEDFSTRRLGESDSHEEREPVRFAFKREAMRAW